MRMWGLPLGLLLSACGPLAAAAQAPPAPTDRAAWAACRQAPTRICLIDAAMSIVESTGATMFLPVIGKAQARAGQKKQAAETFRRALATAQAPGFERIRVGLTAEVARAQSESGFAADAEATFAHAAKLAAASGQPEQLQTVAAQQANAGAVAAALQLAQSTSDEGVLSAVQRRGVEAHINAGRLADAVQLARSIKTESVRDDAVASVVRALAGAGRLADAEPLAAALKPPRFRAAALADIAAAHAKAGREDAATAGFAQAAGLAKSIAEPLMRIMAWDDVARAQARAGLAAEAARTLLQAAVIALETAPPMQRAVIFQVAYTYAEIGAFTDAVELARLLEDQRGMRSLALTMIVKAEANAGRIAEAVALAETIPVVESRAVALAETALAMPR